MITEERLTAVAENVPRVFDAGKQSAYDRFWDICQQNGDRTDYQLAFAGTGWNEENFKPKYDIIPTQAFELFRGNTLAIDLPEYLKNLGITLDMSRVTSGSSAFYNSAFTRIGVLDIRMMATLSYFFHNCKNLVTIDEIILRDDGTQTVSNCFGNCSALVNLKISGVLGSNGLDLKSSVLLSRESIESIIACLSDSKSGLTLTLSSAAVAAAFSEEEWTALKNTKQNWNIELL